MITHFISLMSLMSSISYVWESKLLSESPRTQHSASSQWSNLTLWSEIQCDNHQATTHRSDRFDQMTMLFCTAGEFCQPLGDQNVWGTLYPITKNKEVVVLATKVNMTGRSYHLMIQWYLKFTQYANTLYVKRALITILYKSSKILVSVWKENDGKLHHLQIYFFCSLVD